MIRFICAIILGMFVIGCTQENSGTSGVVRPASESDGQSATNTEPMVLSGEAAYYIACAACHETGASGAPVTGDPDAWADRSSLWQAVLADHANRGYMDMPAKGGRVELSEWVVIRATEYMMSLTYPEMPPE